MTVPLSPFTNYASLEIVVLTLHPSLYRNGTVISWIMSILAISQPVFIIPVIFFSFFSFCFSLLWYVPITVMSNASQSSFFLTNSTGNRICNTGFWNKYLVSHLCFHVSQTTINFALYLCCLNKIAKD